MPDRFRVALVFAPQWTPLNPHFALAALAGHLGTLDVEVDLHDLNVAFYRHLLSARALRYARARARNVREHLLARTFLANRRKDRSPEAAMDAARLLEIERYEGPLEHHWHRATELLPEALAVFDEPEAFYDPFRLARAYQVVDKVLELTSLPCYPFRVRFNDYETPNCRLTLENLLSVTASRDRNIFIPFFQLQLSRLLGSRPDMVGISINAHSQVIPGLTLARLLKGRTHVTLGGNYFIRVKEALLKHARFLETFADSVIVGEGERPMDALVETLRRGGELAGVPNLIHLHEGRPAFTGETKAYPLNRHALPSLDALPLADYFSPETVLSMRTSKGCYWQKCTFCDTDYGICPDIKSVERTTEEMAHLYSRYGVRNFCFIDEAIRPTFMERLCAALAERSVKVHWYGNGRTEKSFTAERLETMARGGLTMLMWGLESGSDRIMKLINKGVDLGRRLDILRDSAHAGIWNFGYVFFGFPSETDEEAMQTIRLLLDNPDAIHSYGRSVFTLGKHARLSRDAFTLGLVEDLHDSEEFSTTLDYVTVDPEERSRVLARADLCRELCSQAQGQPLWMVLRYREVMHLYLQRHGRDFVRDFRFTPGELLHLRELFETPREQPLALGSDNP